MANVIRKSPLQCVDSSREVSEVVRDYIILSICSLLAASLREYFMLDIRIAILLS